MSHVLYLSDLFMLLLNTFSIHIYTELCETSALPKMDSLSK